jgi:predicted Zn-dependent protease with MMP-like domain
MASGESDFSIEEFERMAEEAVESLPEYFRNAMQNVRIIVDDEPERALRRRGGFRSSNLLLGLYHGVPLSQRGSSYGAWPVVPDTITIYRRNILAVAAGPAEVPKIVRDTIIHEIGHHFGMSEREIREAGY